MLRKPLPRRAFLRGIGKGAGVAIGLPLLEAMIPCRLLGSAEAAADAAQAQPHNRLLILYYPNGIHTPNWYPDPPEGEALNTAGPLEYKNYEFTPALKPIERFRDDFTLISGLSVPLAKLDGGGDHAKAMACYL